MQALLKACGRPLAAPSANASGLISPTRASHVLASARRPNPAGDRRRRRPQRGIESTIVAATGGPLRLLRRGPIEVDAAEATRAARSRRPGSSPAIMRRASRCASTRPRREDGEYLIGFGPVAGDAIAQRDRRPGRSGGAAVRPAPPGRCRARSRASPSRPIPGDGIAAAIRDRLKRAAAPRPDQRNQVAASQLFTRAWKLFLSFCSLGGMTAMQ